MGQVRGYGLRTSSRRILGLAAAAAARVIVAGALAGASAAYGDATPTSWLSPTSGNWTDGTQWSTGVYPNNDTASGTTYDATINASGAPYTVTLGTSVTVDSLTLGSAQTVLNQTAGVLTVTGPMDLQDSTCQLAGTLRGATLQTGAGTLTVPSSITTAKLDGVTLSGTVPLNARSLTLLNGLNLDNATAIFGNASTASTLTFQGSSTIMGSGTLSAAKGLTLNTNSPTTTLTMGPGVTVDTSSTSSASWYINLPLINYGKFNILSSTIYTTSTFSNQGTISLQLGELHLTGSIKTADIGSIVVSSGHMFFDDITVDNKQSLLDLDMVGNAYWRNATILGGSIRSTGAARIGGTVTLDAVVVDAPIGIIKIKNGMTIARPSLALQSASGLWNSSDNSLISGTCTITVLHPGFTGFGDSYRFTNLVMGPGITVRTDATPIVNLHGPLAFDHCATYGTVCAEGAYMDVQFYDIRNYGTIQLSAGSLFLGGTFTLSNIGTLVQTGGKVVVNGTFDLTSGPLVLDSPTKTWVCGQINYGGGRLQNGSVTTRGGGSITVAIGTFDAVVFSGLAIVGQNTGFSANKLSIAHDLTLDGGTIVLQGGLRTYYTNTDVAYNNASIAFETSALPQSIKGQGCIVFNGVGSNNQIGYRLPFILGPGVTIRTGTHGGFISGGTGADNYGLISAETPGQCIMIDSGSTLNNYGVISATNGGIISASFGILKNYGTISLDGGYLVVQDLAPLGGTLLRDNGQVVLGRSLTTSGGSVDFGATSLGRVDLGYDSSVSGVTLTCTGGPIHVVNVSAFSDIALVPPVLAVTLASDLIVEGGATLNLKYGFTLANSTIHVGNQGGPGVLSLNSLSTLTGSGAVVFDGTVPSTLTPSTNNAYLTIASGVRVSTGTAGGILGGTSLSYLTVKGAITSPTANRDLAVTVANLTNNGLIEATNGGTIHMNISGSNSNASGTLHAGPHSTLYMNLLTESTTTTTMIDLESLATSGSIAVSGAASLSGALKVAYGPDFAPRFGDTFTLVKMGSRSGTFTSFSYSPLPYGWTFALSYSPTTVSAKVVPEPSTLGLLAIAGTGLLVRRRRR